MRWFNFFSVSKRHDDGTVDGAWMQGHFGTIDSARKSAADTNEANSNRLDIVVSDVNVGTRPDLRHHYNVRPL